MKNTEVYLSHILECIDAILSDYFAGASDPKELFLHDDKIKQATLHRLQTLGQAVKSIPPEIRQRISSQLDWKKIAGFRDVLVHEYLGVDLDIVWSVIEQQLPCYGKK